MPVNKNEYFIYLPNTVAKTVVDIWQKIEEDLKLRKMVDVSQYPESSIEDINVLVNWTTTKFTSYNLCKISMNKSLSNNILKYHLMYDLFAIVNTYIRIGIYLVFVILSPNYSIFFLFYVSRPSEFRWLWLSTTYCHF